MDGSYKVASRFNVDRNLPSAVIDCRSRDQFLDRVSSMRVANIFERQIYRHVVSGVQVLGPAEGRGGDAWETRANYVIIRTMEHDGSMVVYSCGQYRDVVVFENGHCRPAGSNVGDFEPMSVPALAKEASYYGGTIAGHAEINVVNQGPGFGTHVVDVEVDRQTGAVKVLRYSIVQDAGKAVFPEFVKGQWHGAAAQGIGMALNEEYIYNDKGQMINAGFLDYRIPVASDLPYLHAEIVEVPNPNHPYGVRGVGEVPIIPPIAAIANAIYDATGVRVYEQPFSPPRILAALDAVAPKLAAE